MENLVITFKYENGNINQIMSKSDFDKLVNMWGLDELKSILLDDEKNELINYLTNKKYKIKSEAGICLAVK
jgi:hypothetical protein